MCYGHVAATGEKFPHPLSLSPFFASLFFLTSIKIFLQAFLAARARRADADAEHAPPRLYTDPDGITHRRGCRSLPERAEVDPVVRFRSKKGKCQNLSPAILFWLLFLLPPFLPSLFRAPLPPSILPSLFYPLVSPPQKAIINLHFITQLQEEKEAKEAESITST